MDDPPIVDPSYDLVVLPTTGEVVSLENPEECARALVEIQDLKSRLREFESVLKRSLLEASSEQGTKTLHFSGMVASITTPVTTIWDHEVLGELREAGLPEERFNQLVRAEVTYKVDRSVARSIAGANETYASILERAQEKIPGEPGVSVKKGGA
jgi:hypothetical protein